MPKFDAHRPALSLTPTSGGPMPDERLLDYIQECWSICQWPGEPPTYYVAEGMRHGGGQVRGPFPTREAALVHLFETLMELMVETVLTVD